MHSSWRILFSVPKVGVVCMMLAIVSGQGFGKDKNKKEEISLSVSLSTKGNNIEFDQKSLQVPFGSKVTLKFRNMAATHSQIDHNVVILKPGTEDSFIADLQRDSYDMEKVRKSPHVIVVSRLLHPEEETKISFTPEKPGFYPYLCVMPGHGDILGMKGVLYVKE